MKLVRALREQEAPVTAYYVLALLVAALVGVALAGLPGSGVG